MGFYNASAAVRYIVLTLKTLLHWMLCRLSPWIVSLNVCTGGELGSAHTLLGCDSGSEHVWILTLHCHTQSLRSPNLPFDEQHIHFPVCQSLWKILGLYSSKCIILLNNFISEALWKHWNKYSLLGLFWLLLELTVPLAFDSFLSL